VRRGSGVWFNRRDSKSREPLRLRGFESPPLRHRVLISGASPLTTGEISQRTGQTVYLVYNDDIDQPFPNARQQPLQGGPLYGAAREPAIIVGGLYQTPAFARLTFDECLVALLRNPKNKGPDQRDPVIKRATSDSERYCCVR
jgi:hypothetical protein